jgi:hypothetical protein
VESVSNELTVEHDRRAGDRDIHHALQIPAGSFALREALFVNRVLDAVVVDIAQVALR